MKKKLISIILVLAMLCYVFTACGKKEEMSQDSSGVEVTIADLDEDTEPLAWLPLADKTSHPELRASFEEYFETTTESDNTKTGQLYFNGQTGEADQNNTFLNVLAIYDFNTKFTEGSDDMKQLGEIASKEYSDLEDEEAPYASINAFFELLPDDEDNTFNGSESLTRAHAMTLLMRAVTPVNETQSPESNEDFTKCVGKTVYTDYASYMDSYAYVNTSNTLNEASFKGKMSRAEYVYMVSNYLINLFESKVTESGLTVDYFKNNLVQDPQLTALKDAGDITLTEALENPEAGVPTEMYNVFKEAIRYGIIPNDPDAQSELLENWDDTITKSQALTDLTNMSLSYYNLIPVGTTSYDTKDDKTIEEKKEEEWAEITKMVRKQMPDDYNGSVTQYWSEMAHKGGADSVNGWCWIYKNGSAAGNNPTYAVYMKEGDPKYGTVYHLGDTLPNGDVLKYGSNAEYEEYEKEAALKALQEDEGDGYHLEYHDDGKVTIVLDE